MEHTINANPGDTIVIRIANESGTTKQQVISIPQRKNKTQSQLFIEHVCNATGYTPEQIRGKKGNQYLCAVRFYIAYVLYTEYRLSKSEIGRQINRDHTSVIHAIATYTDLTDSKDEIMMQTIKQIPPYAAD